MCCCLICWTCAGSGFFFAPAATLACPCSAAWFVVENDWPVFADVAVVEVPPCDVFSVTACSFSAWLCFPSCSFTVGAALATGSLETLAPLPAWPPGFGLASAFCGFNGARSLFIPCCFTAVVASGLTAFSPRTFGWAFSTFSAPCFPFFGDCSGSGCANAAPASTREQPISTLVNFFILVSLL